MLRTALIYINKTFSARALGNIYIFLWKNESSLQGDHYIFSSLMRYFWVLNMVWLHPFPHTENYNLFLLSVISDLFALSVEKRPVFEPKQAMNKEHHISLYSQFVVVLYAIILFFFLVPFCDNSLLVLKMRFRVFSLARKKFFQWQKDINVVVISVFSSTKSCLSFSKF